MNQINHDIVTTAYGGGNRGLPFLNQRLGIAEPHVGSVRQPRNADKVRKAFRFGVDNHLHRKFRSKFRYAEASQFTAVDLFRPDAERFRRSKQRHYLFIIQRDFDRINSRHIL